MKPISKTLLILLLAIAGTATAGNRHDHGKHNSPQGQVLYDYARVIESHPLYREVPVTTPHRECWKEPVYHTRKPQKSASGMLVGGVLGGVIGHQIGSGRGNKLATVAGTLIGAHIGHGAVNGDVEADPSFAGYEERCMTRRHISYEEVLEGYDVTYEYRGRRYHVKMPYDPGARIKMRIQIDPVI